MFSYEYQWLNLVNLARNGPIDRSSDRSFDLKNTLCCYNRGTCEFSRNNPHVFSKYYIACPCQGIPGKNDRFFYRVNTLQI